MFSPDLVAAARVPAEDGAFNAAFRALDWVLATGIVSLRGQGPHTVRTTIPCVHHLLTQQWGGGAI